MIVVSSDPARCRVIAKMSGFLAQEEVAAFSREERAAVAHMGLGSGEFDLLVDTSECVIQAQDVVAAFQQLVATSPLKARRIAIVRDGSLTRLQARRVVERRDTAAVFDTMAEAETWLAA